jgi:hypothetical protein
VVTSLNRFLWGIRRAPATLYLDYVLLTTTVEVAAWPIVHL